MTTQHNKVNYKSSHRPSLIIMSQFHVSFKYTENTHFISNKNAVYSNRSLLENTIRSHKDESTCDLIDSVAFRKYDSSVDFNPLNTELNPICQ